MKIRISATNFYWVNKFIDNELFMTSVVYTLGHSSRPLFEFIEKLQKNKIEVLVDVRSHPQSRFCPQFNQKRLSEELGNVGIIYLFRGKNLGGKGENVRFDETIEELANMVKRGQILCLLCSEKDPAKCHRSQELAPLFVAQGFGVEHII